MAPDLSNAQLHAFLEAGLSQREIARRTGIPRATLQTRLKRLGLQGGPSPVDRPPTPVDRPPDDRPPSTIHSLPSIIDQLQAALTAALQPVLARLDALETGLARPRTDDRPPSTVDPHTSTADPSTVDRPSSTVDPPTWELRELKHSVRWTVYVPLAMKEEIQRLARDRQQPPSVVLQELLWQALRGR
jgi:transcriptional regulator with XRE-family HTH domain